MIGRVINIERGTALLIEQLLAIRHSISYAWVLRKTREDRYGNNSPRPIRGDCYAFYLHQ